MTSVFVYDPTQNDEKSAVRGVGRYLQILKESFPDWKFINFTNFDNLKDSIFINPFFNFWQKPLTMKRIAKKQIAVIHDLIPLKYPNHFPIGIRGKFNIFLNRLALKNYDVIITDSQASRRDVVNMFKISENKVKVIYPCLPKIFAITQNSESQTHSKSEQSTVQDALCRIYSGTEQNSKLKTKTFNFSLLPFNFCLYVGDGTWNKNLVNLAKAIKIINVSGVFVGKVFEEANFQSDFSHPWQKELKDFFELIKDDQRFVLLGYVNDKELLTLYQKAQVNLLISYDEGFGFSYLEAASQGCPSVLSRIEVLKEISNNRGAFFANPKDPYDIADKIGEIYFNKNLRDKLGEQAKKRAKFFNCDKFRLKFLKIIR